MLEAAAKAPPAGERAAINAAMRSLMKVVVVNYRAGRLVFDWQHGVESDLLYAWPEEDEWDAPRSSPATPRATLPKQRAD
jgi:hypothetical protein